MNIEEKKKLIWKTVYDYENITNNKWYDTWKIIAIDTYWNIVVEFDSMKQIFRYATLEEWYLHLTKPKSKIKEHFEANVLDWDDVKGCWWWKLNAEYVYEYIEEFYVLKE